MWLKSRCEVEATLGHCWSGKISSERKLLTKISVPAAVARWVCLSEEPGHEILDHSAKQWNQQITYWDAQRFACADLAQHT